MMGSEDLEEKLIKWDSESYKTGIELAKAEADYNTLEEQKKNVLADIKSRFEGSDTSKESEARTTQEWKAYVEGLNQAHSKFLMARALHNGAKLRWQTAQTLIYKRAGELRRLQ